MTPPVVPVPTYGRPAPVQASFPHPLNERTDVIDPDECKDCGCAGHVDTGVIGGDYCLLCKWCVCRGRSRPLAPRAPVHAAVDPTPDRPETP